MTYCISQDQDERLSCMEAIIIQQLDDVCTNTAAVDLSLPAALITEIKQSCCPKSGEWPHLGDAWVKRSDS